MYTFLQITFLFMHNLLFITGKLFVQAANKLSIAAANFKIILQTLKETLIRVILVTKR